MDELSQQLEDAVNDIVTAFQANTLPIRLSISMEHYSAIVARLRAKGVFDIGLSRDPDGGIWARRVTSHFRHYRRDE